MYKVRYLANDGKTFDFSYDNGVIFDVEGLSGVEIEHTLSQGISQVGKTISSKAAGDKKINITGKLLGDNRRIADRKARLRDNILPFATGRLIFNNDYYINVSPVEIPEYSPVRGKGTFSVRFLTPYPFFRKTAESTSVIGGITKRFRFPVNYATPHIYGESSAERYINVRNNGNLETTYVLTLTTQSESVNPVVSNLLTFEQIKLNYRMLAGETVKIYYDDSNILQVTSTDVNGNVTDIFYRLDEASDLFALHVGDNLLLAVDDSGGKDLTVRVTFDEVVAGVFEA